MSSTSEPADRILLGLALNLARGELSVDEITARIRSSLKTAIDGENVKMLLRAAFMSKAMGGQSDSFCIAHVALLAAQCLTQPDINFGLHIGMGDARVCSAFGMCELISDERQASVAVAAMAELPSILEEAGDGKGLVESLLCIGDLFSCHGYSEAALPTYMRALEQLSKVQDRKTFFITNSSQDMIRLDCKNVFDFNQPCLGAPTTLHTGDLALVIADIDQKLAAQFLRLRKLEDAAGAIRLALELWDSGSISWPSSQIIRYKTLLIYAQVLEEERNLDASCAAAVEALEQAKELKIVLHRLEALTVAADVFERAGRAAESKRFRKDASEISQRLGGMR